MNENDETNEKARHSFVTFWIGLNIFANAMFICLYLLLLAVWNASLEPIIMIFIVGLAANILVLKWKIIGVFIICAVTPGLILLMNFFSYGRLGIPIALGVLMLSAYFGVLNIRKNGISAWKHLLNEAKAKKRETKIWVASVFAFIIVFHALSFFSITKFYGNTIVVFAPQRIIEGWYLFRGKVLGNYVLETEYGEIRIEHLSPVRISFGTYFRQEKLPRNNKLTYFTLNHHGINMYGVPVTIAGIYVNSTRDTADILLFDWVRFLQEHITLADSTELTVRTAELSLYKDEQRWILSVEPSWHNARLFVKRPGETEFTEYRSVTFKSNWGEFIEGEPVEE